MYGIAVPEALDDFVPGERAGRVDVDDGAAVRLAGLAREAALGGDPGQTGEILDPAVDDVLILLEEGGLVLLERVFDGGEDAGQLLLADLHRAAEAVVRVAVGAAAGDQLLRAENEPARLRTADPLAATEDGAGRAEVAGEVPEALDRRNLGGGVDDDRDVALLCDPDHLFDGQRVLGQRSAGEPDDAGGLVGDRGLQLLGGVADLDDGGAGLGDRVVVAVALDLLDDDLGLRQAVEVGEGEGVGGVGPGDAGGDGEHDPGGRAGRDVAGLVVGQLGNALADPFLQGVEVDERFGGGRHGLQHFLGHPRAAEAGQGCRGIDDGLETEILIKRVHISSCPGVDGTALVSLPKIARGCAKGCRTALRRQISTRPPDIRAPGWTL